MATLSKTAQGHWRARIRRTGWPATSKVFRTRRDAADWARSIEDEMVRGLYLRRNEAERLTVPEAIERYLREITPSKRPTTQASERNSAKQLKRFFAGYAMAAVTVELVGRYRDGRLHSGLANNSVRIELALLRHIFAVAIQDWGLGLASNPVALSRKPKPGPARSRRLDRGEEERILEALNRFSNPMLLWITTIAMETAMRRTEIVSLRRSQVDLGRRIVTLFDTKNGATRTVPLSQTAQQTFRLALEHPVRPISCDLIFFGEPGRDGQRRPYQFTRAWEQCLSEAGIRDLHFHDLRHEAVSRLVESGLSDQEVASISGHKSMQMLRRYTHLRSEDLVSKLDAALMRSNKTSSAA